MSSNDKIRVVYIMEECPAYGLYKDSGRPEISWDTPDGTWVGIWGYDWGNQLGDYIQRNDSGISFEVRQPDRRADRVYEHRFESKAVHKLYPAKYDNRGKFVNSEELVRDLTEGDNHNTIVHTGAFGRFTANFLNRIRARAIIGSFHSEIMLPIDNLFTLRKNVMNYRRVFADHLKFKRLINNFDVITYQTDYSLGRLKKYYYGTLKLATMGTDFSVFKKLDKAKCREELNLPEDVKILISVGRINNIKGQFEIASELSKIADECNFLYIILGHGLDAEEKHLAELSGLFRGKSGILFPGYVRGERLVKYLNASDVFIMPSLSEAGPVAAMEAMACELPVITMDTGSVAGFMKEHGYGFVTERGDYTALIRQIKKLLAGGSIVTADRKLAEEKFGWDNVAKNFIKIYRDAIGSN